jgi:oligopeptide/dipeptide ABC transporter ATP-binding protein
VGIARALILDPVFLIGDEPVAALDVSIQAQVLNLLNDLRHQRGLTCMFIAHDLSVVKYVSDRIGVMYLGQLVEWSPARELYREPLHPYTRLLMQAIPLPDPEKRKGRMPATGEAPSLIQRPSGCPFHTRCPLAADRCRQERPVLREIKPSHHTACHFAEQLVHGS